MSIELGQQISLWAVRLALLFWFLFAFSRIVDRSRLQDVKLRGLWTMATVLYAIHVLTAFAYFHEWSHEAAVQHTADRTHEFIGIHWGGGIWFNHFFTVLCTIEMVTWWVRPQAINGRAIRMSWMVYGYCLFIIFNAAIVFVAGPTRWINTVALLMLVALYFRNHPRNEPRN